MLLGGGKVYFSDSKAGVDVEVPVSYLAEITEPAVAVDWQNATPAELSESDLEKDPADQANFAALPPAACISKNYAVWKRSFADTLYRTQKLAMFKSPVSIWCLGPMKPRGLPPPDAASCPGRTGPTEGTLRGKYAPRIAALQEKSAVLSRPWSAKPTSHSEKFQTAISFGTTLLGTFLAGGR